MGRMTDGVGRNECKVLVLLCGVLVLVMMVMMVM